MICPVCAKDVAPGEVMIYCGSCEDCWVDRQSVGGGERFSGRGKFMRVEKGWSQLEYPSRFLRGATSDA